MTSFIYKYGALLFILNTIFMSAYIFSAFAKFYFPLLMGLYLILIILKPQTYINLTLQKTFYIFLVVNIVNLIHLIFFDHTIESFLYFITKVTIFYIISLSIFFNHEYYRDKFFTHMVWVGLFFVIASLLYSQNFSSGYKGIIGNRNEFGILMATIFGILYLHKAKHNFYEKLFMLVLLGLILMCGSRNALIGVFLALIFKSGINIKTLSFLPLLAIAYFTLDYMQIETTLNRIAEESDTFHDRRMEFYYAWKTFLNKPWIGYGLEHYAYIDQSLVPRYLLLKYKMVMSHNSYLAGLVMYGLPFFIIIFLAIFSITIPAYIKYFTSKDFRESQGANIWFFILSYTFVSSIVESHMFGINAFHGFMFWFSLGMVSWIYFEYQKNRGKIDA